MKIPVAVISIALACIVAIQGWTLVEIVNLKVQVAQLAERIAKTTHEKNSLTGSLAGIDRL